MTTRELHRSVRRPGSCEQGGAVLAVGLILMVFLSLIGLYGSRVEMLNLRSAGNEYRTREAMSAAEYGAERAAAYVAANRRTMAPSGWTSCSGVTALPCSAITNTTERARWRYTAFNGKTDIDGSTVATPGLAGTTGTFTTWIMAMQVGDPSLINGADESWRQYFSIVSVGNSSDGSGEAALKQIIYDAPAVPGSGPAAPLVASGSVDLGGNINIWGNPNGGGDGVPLSVWSSADSGDHGSPNTFHQDGEPLSSASTENYDILDVDGGDGVNPDSTNFPDDVFAYTFGTPATNWRKIYQLAYDEGQVYADCSGLGATSSGIIWVTGDCSLGTGNVGAWNSSTNVYTAVWLIVQGEVRMTGNGTFYGLLYSFCDSVNGSRGIATSDDCGIVQAVGTHVFQGAIVADSATNITSGTFDLHYNKDAIEAGPQGPGGRIMTRIGGTWINWAL